MKERKTLKKRKQGSPLRLSRLQASSWHAYRHGTQPLLSAQTWQTWARAGLTLCVQVTFLITAKKAFVVGDRIGHPTRQKAEGEKNRKETGKLVLRGEERMTPRGGSDTGCLLFISQLLPGVFWMLIKL